MRLTAKIAAVVVITALIPVAAIGYLSYISAKAALENQTLKGLAIIADAKEGHLYSFFEAIKSRAIDFSSDGFIRDSAEAMQKLKAKDPHFSEIQKSLNTHLKRNKQSLDKSIILIMVADLNGKVIASTNDHELGVDESKHDYFIEGKKGAYISDVHIGRHIGKTSNSYQILVSVPLTGRKTGALLGVIINFYDTIELDKITLESYYEPSNILQGARTGRWCEITNTFGYQFIHVWCMNTRIHIASQFSS